jgi:hypothetical protein
MALLLLLLKCWRQPLHWQQARQQQQQWAQQHHHHHHPHQQQPLQRSLLLAPCEAGGRAWVASWRTAAAQQQQQQQQQQQRLQQLAAPPQPQLAQWQRGWRWSAWEGGHAWGGRQRAAQQRPPLLLQGWGQLHCLGSCWEAEGWALVKGCLLLQAPAQLHGWHQQQAVLLMLQLLLPVAPWQQWGVWSWTCWQAGGAWMQWRCQLRPLWQGGVPLQQQQQQRG